MARIQIVDGFKYATKERNEEIFNTIRWNSKVFNKIFILCENQEYFEHYSPLQNDVVRVVNTNKNSFISMQHLFNFVNQNSLPEDIKFISNIDSIYTEDFLTLDVENDYIYSFTNRSMRNPNVNGGKDHHSYVREKNDGLNLFNRDGVLDKNWFMSDEEISYTYWQVAVCGWAWKSVKPLSYEKECFQCYPQAEQCMMHCFRNSGYNLKSAAIKYPTYHNHGSNEKTENNRRGTMGFGGEINELL
jgi:hypothetical protein